MTFYGAAYGNFHRVIAFGQIRIPSDNNISGYIGFVVRTYTISTPTSTECLHRNRSASAIHHYDDHVLTATGKQTLHVQRIHLTLIIHWNLLEGVTNNIAHTDPGAKSYTVQPRSQAAGVGKRERERVWNIYLTPSNLMYSNTVFQLLSYAQRKNTYAFCFIDIRSDFVSTYMYMGYLTLCWWFYARTNKLILLFLLSIVCWIVFTV